MRTYLAFINEDRAGFGVVFPDLPGCTAVGDSFEDAMAKGGEALALYAETLRAAGRSLPKPRSRKAIEAAKLDWIEPGYVVAAIPLFAARRQTTRINVALDALELATIDAAATQAGVDRSTYMVRAALYAAGPAALSRSAAKPARPPRGLAESSTPKFQGKRPSQAKRL